MARRAWLAGARRNIQPVHDREEDSLKIITALCLFALAPAAHAQTNAASSAAAATARFDADTPIETIAADPAGRTVLDRDIPGLLTHPSYEEFKMLSLRQLQPMSGGELTEDQVTKAEADLKALPPETKAETAH